MCEPIVPFEWYGYTDICRSYAYKEDVQQKIAQK